MAVNCCSQLADLYRNCETDTIINYFSKYGECGLCSKNIFSIVSQCSTGGEWTVWNHIESGEGACGKINNRL